MSDKGEKQPAIKTLFLAASGMLASIPGLAIMLKGIGTPPGEEIMFGGIVEAFGALSLLVLWINRGRLRRIARKRITNWTIWLAVIFLLCLSSYVFLFKHCVVHHPTHQTVYYPLWTSGHISEIIDRTGGRYQALDKYGNHSINTAIHEMPQYALASAVTTALLIFLYQGFCTSLTVVFGLLGFHGGATLFGGQVVMQNQHSAES